ncbi:hypothetical protein CU102_17020 [Phyllobacterium brassicacearum]|uniref:Uncharacterized protein n=1 Tax=Phyllobacterium brassicacearum TaxID=314235 RepID=A0A2P7BN74_9HYPH|nr:hypothetical protein [Phyllobacterium brassicacearum]PSH67896.1 hypothetical protein CU102_17020 [Phyllobacterium brassicacearum]TDQ27457.1 hypothetical protein DEV91_112179 [Phyllobacterium brassicacearum]
MNTVDTPEYAILRLKDQIAGNKAVLAAYRLGRPSERSLRVYRHVEMEQAQLEEDLRLLELSTLDTSMIPISHAFRLEILMEVSGLMLVGQEQTLIR